LDAFIFKFINPIHTLKSTNFVSSLLRRQQNTLQIQSNGQTKIKFG